MKWFSAKKIFLDYASATPVLLEVRRVMEQYWTEDFYNPNAIYEEGLRVKREVEKFRTQIAQMFGASAENVIFTSGGTESNTWAVRGVKRGRIVIDEDSHPSVIEAAKGIEGKETTLVSSITTNNKLGRKIREERKKHQPAGGQYPLLHIDASQTAQYFNIGLEALACDIITLDSSKLYGPKGIGALIVRKGVKLILPPLGTPPVPLVAGFVKALELAARDREAEYKRLSLLAEKFENFVKKALPQVEVKSQLPNVIHLSVPGILPELLVLALERAGVLVSAGPACESQKPEPPETPVRFSLGKFSTEKELRKAAEIFCQTVQKLIKSR